MVSTCGGRGGRYSLGSLLPALLWGSLLAHHTTYLVDVKIVNNGIKACVEIIQQHHDLDGTRVCIWKWTCPPQPQAWHCQGVRPPPAPQRCCPPSPALTCMGVLSAERAVKPTMSLK